MINDEGKLRHDGKYMRNQYKGMSDDKVIDGCEKEMRDEGTELKHLQ